MNTSILYISALFIFEQDQTLLWTCVPRAHIQCVNNHYAKSEYKGIRSVGATDNTQITQSQSKHCKGCVVVFMPKLNTSKYTRGIWKVLSLVFYLSNRFTIPIMYGIILKSYLSSMLWDFMRILKCNTKIAL